MTKTKIVETTEYYDKDGKLTKREVREEETVTDEPEKLYETTIRPISQLDEIRNTGDRPLLH